MSYFSMERPIWRPARTREEWEEWKRQEAEEMRLQAQRAAVKKLTGLSQGTTMTHFTVEDAPKREMAESQPIEHYLTNPGERPPATVTISAAWAAKMLKLPPDCEIIASECDGEWLRLQIRRREQ